MVYHKPSCQARSPSFSAPQLVSRVSAWHLFSVGCFFRSGGAGASWSSNRLLFSDPRLLPTTDGKMVGFFTPSVVHPFFIQTYVSKIYDVHLFYIHIFPTSGQDVQKGPKNFKDVMEYLRYQQLTARSHTQPLGRRWKIRDETQAT